MHFPSGGVLSVCHFNPDFSKIFQEVKMNEKKQDYKTNDNFVESLDFVDFNNLSEEFQSK